MWIDYFMAVSLTVLMVFAPGFLLMRAFRFVRLLSLCAAPALSLALYGVLAIVFSRVAIPASTQTLFGAAVVVAAATWIVGLALRRHRPVRESSLSAVLSDARWTTLFLYVGFAIIIGMLFFVRGLDGTEVFFQAWDNAWHLSLIKDFHQHKRLFVVECDRVRRAGTRGGCAGVLSCSVALSLCYGFKLSQRVHSLGGECDKLCIRVDGVSCRDVLPDGMSAWRKTLGSCLGVRHFRCIQSRFPGSFSCSGQFFRISPRSPALPAVMVLFVVFWQRGLSASGRLLIALALFVGIVGLALMQPNAVFTAAVFLAPYCVVLAYRAGDRLPGKTLSVHAKKILAGMLCRLRYRRNLAFAV